MKIVFILGSGHCGSTLLDLLLDSHSKIVGVGEVATLSPNSLCACGQVARGCDFWNSIIDWKSGYNFKIYRSKLNFLLNRNIFISPKKPYKEILPNDYINKSEKVFSRILVNTGTRVIVDSSKNVNRAELLSQSKNIEPIIIHLVRDGRAVTWSYMKKYKKFFPFAWKWAAENLKIEILKRRNQVKYIYVNYSDLCHDPEKILKQILDVLELKFEPQMLDFRKTEHHQIGGNRMKFSSSNQIKEDKEWQKKMPFSKKFIFNILFGWLNFYYKTEKY